MKRINWQRLATIGLCSSLVINAFSGVTAVAETITIESSPTVASSAKEATSASSATPESTESSQETTETSREEVTQETEKPEVVKEEHKEETEAKKQEEETTTSEVVQPNPVLAPTPVSGIGVRADNLATLHQQLYTLLYGVNHLGNYSFPEGKLQFNVKSDDNTSLNLSDFTFDAQIFYQYGTTGTNGATSIVNPVTNQETDSFNIIIPAKTLTAEAGKYQIYNVRNIAFRTPKYIEDMKIIDDPHTIVSATGMRTAAPTFLAPKVEKIEYPDTVAYSAMYTISLARQDLARDTNDYFYMYSINTNQNGSSASAVAYVPTTYSTLQVTHKKVTESFKDTAGATIPAPTGFTQGKQTSITSNNYTFKQAGTLPETYKASNGKTYKFKGWYKGKTKPNTLTTTKAPSYAVTYDDNDDLNVVYEEINFPETTYQFGFVNEAGQLVNPDDISLTYDYKSIVYRGTGAAGSTVSFGTIANNQSGVKVGNLRQVTLTAKNIAQPTVVGWNGEAFANFSINLPKYYKSLNLYDKTGKIDPKYPLPVKTTVSSVSNDTVQPEANVIAELTLTQRADGSFTPREIYSGIDSSVRYPPFLRRTVSYSSSGSITALYQTISGPVYYHLTNRKVTENFVDTSGAKITPPTGFTQGNQIPMTSNTFKYTSAKALPASYSAGGKTYVFQGWYKGKTKPNTLTTSTTPAYNTTFDDNDDMTAVYKEANISANLTMRGAVDVIDNGATMEYWEVLLKNTGEAPLTSVKIKPTTDWAAGISTPTELFILGTGQNTKVRPITKEQWEAGFEIPLDSSLPVGGQLTINLLGTKVTGQPNQVLKAAVEVTGNFNKLTASDTVRIKDLDQETKEPTGEGFISVPTFNFGQVGVAGSTQQHSLKKAADYYGNGTRNPYLRIKKTQPNWSLTAQLSQPKSATDSLPTATRLLLGAAPVSSFSNYNQPTELKNAVGTTSTISLNANNTATRIIANQQFTGSNIYQLDFTFNNVKLEVPANQGVKGQQYQAAITWNLVTGP